LEAQLGPLSNPARAPQAKSQKELDLYLKILTDATPQSVLKDSDAFASQFPESELLGIAYQYEMHAFKDMDNFEGMVTAGQKALLANPDNLNTLLTLAPAMANRASQVKNADKLLGQAEEYARLILSAVEKVKPPLQTSLEKWEATKRGMQSQAHEVLGVVAIDRGQYAIAIDQFKTAISLAPTPMGSQYFRLGLAFAAAGERDSAKEHLLHAAELGPQPVRKLALVEINKLMEKKSSK